MGQLSLTIRLIECEIVFRELQHILNRPFQSFAVGSESAFIHEEVTL